MNNLKNDLLLTLAKRDDENEISREILEKIFVLYRNKVGFGTQEYKNLEQAYYQFYEVLRNNK